MDGWGSRTWNNTQVGQLWYATFITEYGLKPGLIHDVFGILLGRNRWKSEGGCSIFQSSIIGCTDVHSLGQVWRQ